MAARKLLAQGSDPSAARKEELRAAKIAADNSFKAVAELWFKSLHGKNLSGNTIEKKTWFLKEIYPVLGKRPITDITPGEVLDFLSKIEASGRLDVCKRCRQIIGAVFRYAHVRGVGSGDPTPSLRGMLKPPRPVSHPAIIREDEFGRLMRDVDRYPTPIVRLAMQFQALTFTRPVEVRFATWAEIDLEDGIWRIPAERMKMRRPHDVPLVGATRAILKAAADLYPYREPHDPQWVFPSPSCWRKPQCENTLLVALWKMGYKGRHTVHGFRSSASTILHERGYREAVIEFQLAHLEASETKRAYNRAQYWDERVKLMEAWAEIVKGLESDGGTTRALKQAQT